MRDADPRELIVDVSIRYGGTTTLHSTTVSDVATTYQMNWAVAEFLNAISTRNGVIHAVATGVAKKVKHQ